MEIIKIGDEKLTKSEALKKYEGVLLFLDSLRESGIVNMFGATPYITETYGFNKDKSKDLLKFWMDTFNERHKNE